MPNWTKNEVTFTSPFTNNIKIIKEIFEKGSPFNQLIQEPKWDEIPLKGNEKTSDFRKTLYGMKGELPIIEEEKLWNGEIMKLRRFKSTNVQDLRWYDWRWNTWGTKWDVPKDDIEITEISNGEIMVEFSTAWSAPYPIFKKLKKMFKDVNIEWYAQDEDWNEENEGGYLK